MSTYDAGALPSDEDAEEVLAARARALAAPPEGARAPTELHLVLVTGGNLLAVPAHRVRHVAAPKPVTVVPMAPAAVVGIAPVLGGIVAVADLALLVGTGNAVPQEQQTLVLVDDGADPLALLVDGVEELVSLEAFDDSSPGGGALAGPPTDGLRRLNLDALLADPRLASPGGPSPEHAQGAS